MRIPPRLMAAVITAFDENGEIDEAGHRHNVRTLHDRDLDGLVLAGSTGEGPYLEDGEREALTLATRDELGRDFFIVCGINAESVRQARKQISEAVTGGADAILVMTPTTLIRNRATPMVRFYTVLADESPLPMFIYSVPVVTAYELPFDIVVELAQHPNIVGVKDSGGEADRIGAIAEATDRDFFVFCGASRAVLSAVAGGAHGAITASANYASHLVAAAIAGDETAQRELASVSSEVEALGVPGTKAAAERSGLVGGRPRLPLGSVNSSM